MSRTFRVGVGKSGGARDALIASGILGVAVACRFALDQVVPGKLPFITFFPAIVATAYLCSFRTSIIVLLVSAAIGAYGFAPPPGADLIYRLLAASVFTAVGALMIYLVAELKKERARGRRHEEQLELINRELKHRLRNLFAISSSISVQTIKSGLPPEQMAHAVAGRINAIASAQEALSVASLFSGEVGELAETLLTNLAPSPDKIVMTGPPISLPAELTTPFALVLHELGTNSLKYGAWSDAGRVEVTWSVSRGRLHFDWREFGGPSVTAPTREGLGSVLIRKALPHATVQHEFLPDGVHCRIDLQLAPAS